MAITTVLLDLDNTLYAYQPAHEAGLQRIAEMAPEIGVAEADLLAAWKRGRSLTHQRLESKAASHNRMLYAQYTCEALGLPGGAALKIYEGYWNAFMQAMQLRPGVMEFLKHLKEQGYKTCVVSDLTANIQFRKMNLYGLWQYIPLIVTSEEAGVEKPNPLPFLLALNKCGSMAEEAVMIGDSLKKDIEGAQALGIQGRYFMEEGPAPEGIRSFTSFEELLHEF